MSTPTNPPSGPPPSSPPGTPPAPAAPHPAAGTPLPRVHLPLEELTKRLAEAEHRIAGLEAERSTQATKLRAAESRYTDPANRLMYLAQPEMRTELRNQINQMKEHLIALDATLATERDSRDRAEERIARHHDNEEARRDKEEARLDKAAGRRSQLIGHGMTFAGLVVAALGILVGQCSKNPPQEVKVTCPPPAAAPMFMDP